MNANKRTGLRFPKSTLNMWPMKLSGCPLITAHKSTSRIPVYVTLAIFLIPYLKNGYLVKGGRGRDVSWARCLHARLSGRNRAQHKPRAKKMDVLCNSAHFLSLKQPSCSTSPMFTHPFLHKSQFHILNWPIKFRGVVSSVAYAPFSLRKYRVEARAADHTASAGASDIDMVRTRDGVYAAKQKKVVVLWDLDNKPPRGQPYQAAMALKHVAEQFGEVVDMSAYANRHAFVHLPQWVLEERRERRRVDAFEQKGMVKPTEPYVCNVCGRKCKTNLDLKKHFRQLHERERQKKLNRMRSLKGKKRQRYKERFIDGNHKYEEAARTLLTPKVGYGLAPELRRAGVFVKTVEDKPQAADWALKRQMQHSMGRGVDWLFLISDDSDFSEMLRRARESSLGTVVVGDGHGALGREADLWVPWFGVENGDVSEKDFVARSRRRSAFMDRHGESISLTHFHQDTNGEENLVSVVDELLATRTDFNNVRISAFSEGEEEEDNWTSIDDDNGDDDFLLDTDGEDDGYF